MGPGLLSFVALIYMYVAWIYWQAGRTGLALAFVAYALSNVGFVLDLIWSKG